MMQYRQFYMNGNNNILVYCLQVYKIYAFPSVFPRSFVYELRALRLHRCTSHRTINNKVMQFFLERQSETTLEYALLFLMHAIFHLYVRFYCFDARFVLPLFFSNGITCDASANCIYDFSQSIHVIDLELFPAFGFLRNVFGRCKSGAS